MAVQGELWTVDLNPVRGSEQAGFCPVLVVSGNLMNAHLNVVWVCPLTSKLHGYAGNPQLQPSTENGLSVPSEVLVVHLRSLDRSRLIQRLGSVDPEVMDVVHQSVAKILKY